MRESGSDLALVTPDQAAVGVGRRPCRRLGRRLQGDIARPVVDELSIDADVSIVGYAQLVDRSLMGASAAVPRDSCPAPPLRALSFTMEEQLRLAVVPPAGSENGNGPIADARTAAGRAEPRRLEEFGAVLTVEEAAQVLRISRASAYELARRWRSQNPSGLPVIQLGRFLRVPKSALEQVLARPGELYATLVPADDRG